METLQVRQEAGMFILVILSIIHNIGIGIISLIHINVLLVTLLALLGLRLQAITHPPMHGQRYGLSFSPQG
jgi:hypothetical protein